MGDLKLAFETVIVGLLAIPWLFVLSHTIFYLVTRRSLLKFLADKHQSFTFIGPLVIGFAYCAGTIIFPLADEYFNDSWRFPIYVRGDDAIRVDTFTSVYFRRKKSDDVAPRYYELNQDDFPNLADAAANVREIVGLESEIVKIDKDDNLETINEGLYKKLKKPIHAIYNYQKFYDYNSAEHYEVLKPLRSQIVVLRGAVLNGLFLWAALLLLCLVALVEIIHRRSKERTHELLILISIGVIVWGLSWWGAWGVTKAEEEYDKHVIGLFYGSRTGYAIKKMIEHEGNNAEQKTEK